jgi:formylglycine-generating enzyme required for sulfatase activity
VAALLVGLGGCKQGTFRSDHPPPDPSLYDTWNRPADEMMMVYVPGGEFEMGSMEGASDEPPEHTVALDGFWMDRTEVTNAQFAAFMNEQGNHVDGGGTWLQVEAEGSLIERIGEEYQPKSGFADHPVVEVSWFGAAAYCEWTGARLPTEAEWEYAARGPQGPIYPWGDKFDCSRGNFDDETQMDGYVVPGGEGCDGYERTAPVGSFPAGASWCRALDMAGNVWEWVGDWYDSDYYDRSTFRNPMGPSSGTDRVLRGGSYYVTQGHDRATNRNHYVPAARYDFLGFRCAYR